MADLERGLIQFFQACLPPLVPGEYRIDVEHTIREARPEPFRTGLDFSVAGPRFTLNPADVYSVYPPANQAGAYGNTLPHIVLVRRTLPWERTLDGSAPDEKNPCPWLALLVLSPSDFPNSELPKMDIRKVQELLRPGHGIKGPDLNTTELKEYESVDDLCNTIDLPTSLFTSIVPAKADLPYLAHVRQVQTDKKETASLHTEGCFSVVLANRFPETAKGRDGGRNLAVLVSLEGFHTYLHGEAGIISEKTVRLAVLAHWSFSSQGQTTFKTLISQLDTGLLQLPPPMNTVAAEGSDDVKHAYSLGYTALTHRIRNGETTVSWYRGPLVPLFYRKLDVYRSLPCPDAALRYHYDTGLLDVSYAAAWQLGRLLALQSPLFAQTIYRTRHHERQRVHAKMEEAAQRQQYEVPGNEMSEYLAQEMGKLTNELK